MRQLKIVTQITNRDTQATEKYLQEIGKIGMITPEQETELAIRIKSGDQKAIDQLVEANLRFVVSVAKQYQHQGLSLSDLINEGNIGLIKAAQRFDHTKGFKFISYAVWRIRQSILQALAEQGKLVRVPLNRIGAYNKASKAAAAFEQEWEREPSVEELAELVDLDEREIAHLFAANQRHSSLDAEIGGEHGDGLTLGDTIKATSENIDAIFGTYKNEGELSESLNAFLKLARLNNREEEILLAWYGIGSYTIEQIGYKYDITKERIRQIKERIIKGLIKKNKSTTILQDDFHIKEENKKTKKNTEERLQEKKPLKVSKKHRQLDTTSPQITSQNMGTQVTATNNKQSKSTGAKNNVESHAAPKDKSSNQDKKLDTIFNTLLGLYEKLDVIFKALDTYQKENTTHTEIEIIHSIENQSMHFKKTLDTIITDYKKLKKHDNLVEEWIQNSSEKITTVTSILQEIKNNNGTTLTAEQHEEPTHSLLEHELPEDRVSDDLKAQEILPVAHEPEMIHVPEIVHDTDIDTIGEIEVNTSNIGRKERDTPEQLEDIISATGNEIVHILEGKENLPECEKRQQTYAITEIKIEALFVQGYNWKSHLDTIGHSKNSNEYVAINTFFHYYIATKNSSVGKREKFPAIITRAKRYTGKIINESDFHKYIVDFLDSITDITL